MQTLNYWKQFENTGRVEDYLSYVATQTFDSVQMSDPEEDKAEGDEEGKAGVNPYAGIHMCNRNDIKTDAYRGI